MSYQAQHVKISGKTFDHRETFKRHGGMWDGATKTWEFGTLPLDKVAEFEKTVGLVVTKISEPRTVFQPGDERPEAEASEPGDAPAAAPSSEPAPDRSEPGTRLFGDGVEYFDTFAGTPKAYFEFHSLGSLVDYVEKNGRNECGWDTGRSEWVGTYDMPEAIKIARNGWARGAKMASEALSVLTADHATTKGRRYSVAGSRTNVGRMLASNPMHMVTRSKREGRKVITLYVAINMSAAVSADDMIIRAACVAAIADLLEDSGYSSEIVVTDNRVHNGYSPRARIAVRVKTAGEALNLNDIVFALGHPSMLRRLHFAVIGSDPRLKTMYGSQGRPGVSFTADHPAPVDEFSIEHFADGDITGRTFIERVRSAFIASVPPNFPIHLTE